MLARAILASAIALCAPVALVHAAPTAPPDATKQAAPPDQVPTIEQARALLTAADAAVADATDPRLEAVQRLNAESARQLIVALGDIQTLTEELDRMRGALVETRRLLKSDEDRVRLADTANGPQSIILLRHRRELPPLRTLKAGVDLVRRRATDAEIGRLDIADQIAALERPQVQAQALIAAHSSGSASLAEIEAELKARSETFLRPLLAAKARQAALLGEYESASAEYMVLVEQYRAFLGAHALWLPNTTPIGARDLTDLRVQLDAVASVDAWRRVRDGILASMDQSPTRWMLSGAAVLALLLARGRLRRQVRQSSLRLGASDDRFSDTLKGIAATAAIAAPLPLALVFFGNLLQSSLVDATTAALGQSMTAIAGIVSLACFLLALCATDGVADMHFKWAPVVRSSLQRAALLLLLVALPLVFACFVSVSADQAQGGGAMARWTIIGALLVMSGISARLFSPAHGIFSPLIAAHPRGWLSTLRSLWYPLLVVLPLVLAGAAAGGYVITAVAIVWKMSRTYWLILWIAIGLSLVARLGNSALDRFGLRSDLEDQEEQRVHDQVRRLVHLLTLLALIGGFIWAWNELLPAAAVLNAYSLWTVDGGAGMPAVSVTPADLVLAVITVAVTVATVRDLPGFLSMAVLRRFPLDSSARYAIVALSRYFIVMVGLVVAFAFLHIGWANVQWLAAAVTVGLGFGLQEIFANFVSGLIMLAERPVSIGDIVTVDTVTGRVKKISTRATIIVDADNRDVIIPNKQFITGRIVNWTMDGTPVRSVLPVGVAYGTDLAKAERVLLEAVTGVTGVLASPSPEVLLRAFGPSTIDFEVRFHVDRPAISLAAHHELMQRVNAMFAQNGIQIAFPQMDVHLRQAAPG